MGKIKRLNKRGQMGIFSNFTLMILFVVVVFVVGIIAGIIYFDVATIQTSIKTINFTIPIQNNASLTNNSITNFQDIMGLVVYPILNIKDALPYLVYFLIFALIIGMAITAYVSSRNPIFFTLHVLFLILITYLSILLSNAYVQLISNQFMNQIMADFVIYNKVMLYLPQIIFFTGLLFGIIAFVNLIKPQTNRSVTGLNYGGDY